jgi:hypothetical protein
MAAAEQGRAGNGLGVLGVMPTAKAALGTGVKHASLSLLGNQPSPY